MAKVLELQLQHQVPYIQTFKLQTFTDVNVPLYTSCWTVPLCFSRYCSLSLECLLYFLYLIVFYVLFVWKVLQTITVQYYIADCVSWEPKLTLLDLWTNWTHKCALYTPFPCSLLHSHLPSVISLATLHQWSTLGTIHPGQNHAKPSRNVQRKVPVWLEHPIRCQGKSRSSSYVCGGENMFIFTEKVKLFPSST